MIIAEGEDNYANEEMAWHGQLNHKGTDGLAGMAESYSLAAGICKRELKRKEMGKWDRLARRGRGRK